MSGVQYNTSYREETHTQEKHKDMQLDIPLAHGRTPHISFYLYGILRSGDGVVKGNWRMGRLTRRSTLNQSIPDTTPLTRDHTNSPHGDAYGMPHERALLAVEKLLVCRRIPALRGLSADDCAVIGIAGDDSDVGLFFVVSYSKIQIGSLLN
jgi:hypothetical protein